MMMSFLSLFSFLLCAIQLTGVTGTGLRARAFFDANNVKVGDPLVLTVDFAGTADFSNLHPPSLARSVSRKDWKVDDASAKTDTLDAGAFPFVRRLVYRVRPMREGVLWFPSLEFSYRAADGKELVVRANEIPVSARAGAQVVVEGMKEDPNELPSAPALIRDAAFCAPAGFSLSDDEAFAWKRACAVPKSASFAAFAFPAAKLNEASCAIREGNWAHALSVYRILEWRIGQTPEIERGIVSALALRYENPTVELPVWRQVLRPWLRFDGYGRVGLFLGGLLALVLVFYLIGRLIRVFACVALAALLVATAYGETVETVTTNADGSITHRKVVTGGKGGFSFSFSSSSSSGGNAGSGPGVGGMRSFFGSDPFEMMDNFDPFGMRRSRARRPKPEIRVTLAPDKPEVRVGENFNLVLSVDMPRYISIAEGLRVAIAEQDRMQALGNGYPLENAESANETNVVRRFVFPMRANVPFAGLHYTVGFSYEYVGDRSFFRTATPYESGTRKGRLSVLPLPAEGRPADFSNIVSEGLALVETCDRTRVETNDIVTVTYRLVPNGYVPDGFLPKGAAFEWARPRDRQGQGAGVEYRRFVVADGVRETPKTTVSYYDPKAKAYREVTAGGTKLIYSKARTE